MYKSFLIAGCCLLGACQLQNDSKKNTNINQVDSETGMSAFQKEGAKMLNQYLQLKGHVSSINDTNRLHILAKEMMRLADSATMLADNLPELIRDSVVTASMALSDELSGLSIETDLHEIQMAFQVSSLQLFELLKWMKLPGVKIYKFYDVEGISAKGATWLDITSGSVQPYEAKSNSQKLLITDSLIH
ncbi:MAG: hypothetical protein WCH59_07835 [Chitinophagia bacterium]|jgi:hypothetical protein